VSGLPTPGLSNADLPALALHAAPAIHRTIVRRHAEDAAFYWARRREACRSSQHDRASIGRLEALLEANLEGLRVADDESGPEAAGWLASWRRSQAWRSADEAFVSAMAAIRRGGGSPTAAELRQLCDLACDQFDALASGQQPHLVRGIASAAAWSPWPLVATLVHDWAESAEPALRLAAVSACALHRLPMGEAAEAWLDDPHPAVRARACRAVAECGGEAVREALAERLHDTSRAGFAAAPVAESAAYALCLLADTRGIEALDALPSSDPRHRAAWAVAAPDDAVIAAVERALEQRATWRDAIALLRWSGLRQGGALLLQIVEHELQPDRIQAGFAAPGDNLARAAADALAHLSGLRIEDALATPAPADQAGAGDALAAEPAIPVARKTDPDEGLPWPALDPLQQRWTAVAGRLDAAGDGVTSRCLDGRPLVAAASAGGAEAAEAAAATSATTTLCAPTATALQRVQAALWLRTAGRTRELFDVHAAWPVQRARAAAIGLPLA
jgi:hypothetical protein